MTETADDCPSCRHKLDAPDERTGLICMRLEPAMPAKFMRRPSGLCGPAAKLWEPAHKRKDGADVRKRH